MKYINRDDAQISHIFNNETESFNSPECRPDLGIWKQYLHYASSVNDNPQYPICKRCLCRWLSEPLSIKATAGQ